MSSNSTNATVPDLTPITQYVPEWVEQEPLEDRVDIALILGAFCSALLLLLLLLRFFSCCCATSTRDVKSNEEFKPLKSEEVEAEEEEEEEVRAQEYDVEEAAAVVRDDTHYANGASTPETPLKLEPAPLVEETPPPVLPYHHTGGAEDAPPLEAAAAAPSRTPARYTEVSRQLHAAMLAEETWRHRAESAEGGERIGTPRAKALAEASLRDKVGDADEMPVVASATQLAETTMKLVSAELSAETFRRRAEEAERGLGDRVN